jgi:hypothetical protein
LYGTIQVKVNASDDVLNYLEHQCKQSNSLINCTLFEVRQSHFGNCPVSEYFDAAGIYRTGFKLGMVSAPYAHLCTLMKNNIHYKALGGQCAQQTLKSVSESFTSFNGLLKLFFKGDGNKPSMPDYRTKGGLAPISFPAQALQFDLETGQCRIPISQENSCFVKEEFGVKASHCCSRRSLMKRETARLEHPFPVNTLTCSMS